MSAASDMLLNKVGDILEDLVGNKIRIEVKPIYRTLNAGFTVEFKDTDG